MKAMREFDNIRNGRFAETCRRLKLEDTADVRAAFWAGIACGIAEQLEDDARITPDNARAAFTEYLKGAAKL